VANVRSLQTAIKQVRRAINAALRSNNRHTSEAFTKVYALLFCAWAEANFSKVIHTPYGFSLDEIAQVKKAKSNGIGNAWKKSVELGLRHLDTTRGSFGPNAQRKLETAIDDYVFDPSVLRNKLAHGQWVVALNSDNDAIQEEHTATLAKLDLVIIDGWVVGHDLLAGVVEGPSAPPGSLARSTPAHWAQVAFGCFVPAAISGATYILARLTRR
jgi:hypothetical protein